MKKFLIIFALILSGCAVREFDSTEYDYSVKSTVLATRAIHQCANKTPTYYEFVKELNTQTMYLYEYEKHHVNNTYSMQGVLELRQLVVDFVTDTKPHTDTYCTHKLSSIQSAARTLSRTISGNRSLDICSSNAMDRLALYEESYSKDKISKEEYVELVNDLIRLVNVDAALCTIQEQNALAEVLSIASKIISALK